MRVGYYAHSKLHATTHVIAYHSHYSARPMALAPLHVSAALDSTVARGQRTVPLLCLRLPDFACFPWLCLVLHVFAWVCLVLPVFAFCGARAAGFACFLQGLPAFACF